MGLYGIIAGILFFSLCVGIIAYMFGRIQEKREKYFEIISGGSSGSEEDVKEKKLQKQRADIARKLKEAEAAAANSDKEKTSIKARMEQAGIDAPVSRYWMWSFIFTISVFLFVSLMGLSSLAKFFITFTAFFGMPKMFLNMKAGRRQKKFMEDFPDALDGMARLLQSGIPMSEAVAMGSREFKGPMKEELTRVYENQRIGIPLGEAALLMSKRIPLPEVNMLATALQIQQETGSSLSEVLENLSSLIRARFRLKRKIKALSSEAKSSAAIIACLPVLVTLGLYLVRQEYIGVLFITLKGKWILFGCVTWMSFGVLIMRQMINFKI